MVLDVVDAVVEVVVPIMGMGGADNTVAVEVADKANNRATRL